MLDVVKSSKRLRMRDKVRPPIRNKVGPPMRYKVGPPLSLPSFLWYTSGEEFYETRTTRPPSKKLSKNPKPVILLGYVLV
ncbi:hypothetical protein E2C01_088106 [Portunus trituberculatus]|uniref:Uncharacterized protein n=1 Tax=Portunus trituberculatus TaxID=210409 RepID=A0A5B7J590_PORTR|nr:hypothetical protein [Portunus trituberculatus]